MEKQSKKGKELKFMKEGSLSIEATPVSAPNQ
jgi:hypothetical protein